MGTLRELAASGQSIWLDYISRRFVTGGELDALIREGLKGLTSNPNIFEKAIVDSDEYKGDIARLTQSSLDANSIYEQLAVADVQAAADAFRGVYDASDGRDGFVSLEVSPGLSRDTQGTLVEARRLWQAVGRPNVMIKVPGTPEGLPAIEALISEGVNVNITLLFSVAVYEQVANAHIRGLQQRAQSGATIDRIASVASFFVSRVDSAVDALLQAKLKSAAPERRAPLEALLGKAAVANAKLAYEHYQHVVESVAWKALAEKGARPQRVLWASTGTKNPKYSDVLYVEELIGPDTVNTVPPATLEAFRDHGRVRNSLAENIQAAHADLEALAAAGISLQSVTQQLLDEGQQLFLEAFKKLIGAVEAARQEQARRAR
jgi:transaldolase/glucose-6-phosphate isomerase